MDTKKLRQKILDLAIHGKLVPQDPNDEPASVLLKRIRAEKERLIAEGKIKRSKKSATSDTSHYENVPFEVPEGWCWCRLDCVGEIVTGSTPPKDNVDYYGGSIPFYKPTDLEQGINTIEASDSLTELGFSVSRQLPEQSILVTCIGATIGKTGLIQKRGTCNQQINAIISNNMVLPEYLYYTCISGYMQSEIIGRASATTLPILNKNKFSEIPIPVPPIQEQQRIISKIETLFSFVIELGNSEKELISTISKAKSKILDLAIHGKLVPQDPNDEPASELLKRINPKFTPYDNAHYENVPFKVPKNWLWLSHNAILDISGGSQPAKSYFKSKEEEGYIRLYQIRDYGETPVPVYIPRELASKTTQKGDILLARYGGSLGKVFIAEEGAYNVAMAKVIFKYNGLINKEYAYFYYLSSLYQDKLKSISRTAQAGFNSTDFEDLFFPLPPIAEQERIVAAINQYYRILDNISANL